MTVSPTTRHTARPTDLMMLRCVCGWKSKELTHEDRLALGVPWYCDDCGKQVGRFVRYSSSERDEAMKAL